ncbi:electron transport complex subunit RsxC [Hahella sp. CCB-MM4]|uniref:electron transport complex subunit RsxC n=1 Tax=Hahella sp. (strain CCB-MM4) TaxID=1926491 RepID=UPI000B9BB949|nr:electron transport complex subunit RsxC [Hahella sp. CCB-MM4]OZG72480.1 electron transport complex subunit RsxC [Hahella sp. CCB-MM4]
MRQIWDFHGGIHPPENKHQSTRQAIKNAGIPQYLFLPLSQHIGQPAVPVVEIGQRVRKGEMVAEAIGPVSVPVHAPTSGTVIAIEDHQVPHPSGLTDSCIVIETDGLDEWTELTPCEDYEELSSSDILHRVRQAGIAGLGGAGFPTAIKLHPPRNDKVNALILNAAECEPYITADDMLMRERASEVIGGLEIMASILQPEECLIGIEDNKPEAIAALREAARETQIEVVVIPTKYPSGGEKQLIRILTGLEVPQGHIPADIGVMCQNVGTSAAVYRAIRYGEPLISRITTVTGDAVAHPGNFDTLIGTRMSHLLTQAGFNADKASRVLMGGPMMGFALLSTDIPIVKTTNCLLAATDLEFPQPQPEQPCIRCGMCAEACPAELLPQQLFWFAKAQEFEKAEMYNLFDCIECGACSYVCPSSIPLVQYYRYSKNQVRTTKLEQEKSDKARERFEFRQSRLQREQEEKEAKRKARAEAAAKAQAARAAEAEAAVDPKKAAVAEAVKRAQAKREQASAPLADLTELESNVQKAKDKLAKVEASLQQAEADQSDMTDKLRNAVAKNRDRLEFAEKALADARKQSSDSDNTGTNTPPQDTEQLQRSIKRQEDKVATLKNAIEEALKSDPDRAAQLQPSLDKSLAKLAELKSALGTNSSDQSENNTPAPDPEQLQVQVDKARDKLLMMQGMLDEARQESPSDDAKVTKLTRAVEKNQERLTAAEKALTDAQQQATPVAPKISAEELETLRTNIDKARDKLSMMQGMLDEAQTESPEDEAKIAKLTRAVEKNLERVNAAETAYQEAGGEIRDPVSQS